MPRPVHPTRLRLLILLIVGIVASVGLVVTPVALADGDPASDVLVFQSYFDPTDVSAPVQIAQLKATLAAAAHAGFPIRVALINSPADLGTATALWERPSAYRQYLGTELSNLYDGQLLVVMPDGFGLYGPSSGPHAVSAAEWAVKALRPGPGVRLVAAALSAVPLLARADGRPISVSSIHVAKLPAPSGAALPASAWVAIAVGLALIGVSWRASLRARPLRMRQHHRT